MSSLEEKKLLTDIKISILSIYEHLENNLELEVYKSNKTKRRAVERELEIIGEAINKLLKINPEIVISYSRQIVDLRNKIIHSYDNVNDIVIWKIIIKDIPVLQKEINNYLEN
ncbi:MAG: HepT-like ribonuclease domain-containing protein [Bacteroidota bacterium]